MSINSAILVYIYTQVYTRTYTRIYSYTSVYILVQYKTIHYSVFSVFR